VSDREEARRLVDDVFDIFEQERAANSDKARAAAQAAAVTVINNFFDRAGWSDFFQRLMVTHVHGKPAGSPAEARELAALIKTRRNFRRALERLLYDLRLLPASRKAVFSMVMGEEGREGAHGGGGVFEPERVAGVDRQGGAAIEALKISLVEMIGYTAGAVGRSETRRLPVELLLRAALAWVWHKTPDGKHPDPVTTETIRAWCTKPGRLAGVFNEAYEKGHTDACANRVDRSKMLASR
jgi:hypothetical protein